MTALTHDEFKALCEWFHEAGTNIDKSIAPYIEKCRPLSKALLKVDMEMIYNSVVDFIKWHNEYLLSTDKTKTV